MFPGGSKGNIEKERVNTDDSSVGLVKRILSRLGLSIKYVRFQGEGGCQGKNVHLLLL